MQIKYICICLTIATICSLAWAAESTSNNGSGSSSTSNTASGNSGSRQGVGSALTASGLLSSLTSLIPTSFSSILPMMLLVGLGALMVPAFGLGLLLREGRRSDTYNVQPNLAYAAQALRNGQMMQANMQANQQQANSNAQTAQADQTFQYYRSFPSFNFNSGMVLEVLEKVMKALDNADKKFS
jgi:hypothetical protein